MDPGAVSSDGVSEKNINLHIVLKLRDMLETAGFDVLLTREEDVSLHDPQYRSISQIKTSDLKNRLKLINEHPDALVISVHQNFYGQSKYSGAQMFAGPQNEESLRLAESLQSAFCTYLQPENTRQVKRLQRTSILFTMRNARRFWLNAVFFRIRRNALN